MCKVLSFLQVSTALVQMIGAKGLNCGVDLGVTRENSSLGNTWIKSLQLCINLGDKEEISGSGSQADNFTNQDMENLGKSTR